MVVLHHCSYIEREGEEDKKEVRVVDDRNII